MKRDYQATFVGDDFKRLSDCFGGSLLKGNPKMARPLDSKMPIHLVLRAEKSLMRLPHTFGKVNVAVASACKRHGVTLYKYANVGNHLHLLIRLSQRRRWAAFIRELCGRVAQLAQSLGGKMKAADRFWKCRPFTRIVRGWTRAFKLAKDYVELNILEAQGFIRRSEVRNLRELREMFEGSG